MSEKKTKNDMNNDEFIAECKRHLNKDRVPYTVWASDDYLLEKAIERLERCVSAEKIRTIIDRHKSDEFTYGMVAALEELFDR